MQESRGCEGLSNSLKKVNKNRLSAIPTPPLKLPLLQWEI